MKKLLKSAYSIAIISGGIIGVGLFSLPYITAKVGILVMLAYFLILGFIVILIHYLFGEVALATPDFLRLPGYVGLHLGEWARKLAIASTIFGFYGVILAYLIIGGEFLTQLLSPAFGGGAVLYTILYFLAGAVIIFFGVKAVSKVQFWGLILFFGVLLAIFLKGFPVLNADNLLLNFNHWPLSFSTFFLPYGPLLFALWGTSLIPEAEEMLGNNKNLLKIIIPISILIPAAVYFLFILLVLGISGFNTSPESILGLKKTLGNGIVSLAFFFGVLTTFTSFLASGLTLKKTLWYDLKIPKNISWLLALSVPLLLFLAGLKDFMGVIGFVGGVLLGLDGILILLMYRKIKKGKGWFFIYPLILVLLGGIIYEIYYFIK